MCCSRHGEGHTSRCSTAQHCPPPSSMSSCAFLAPVLMHPGAPIHHPPLLTHQAHPLHQCQVLPGCCRLPDPCPYHWLAFCCQAGRTATLSACMSMMVPVVLSVSQVGELQDACKQISWPTRHNSDLPESQQANLHIVIKPCTLETFPSWPHLHLSSIPDCRLCSRDASPSQAVFGVSWV